MKNAIRITLAVVLFALVGCKEPDYGTIPDTTIASLGTPADNEIDAIIDLTFSDGRMYGGILIPKGNVQVNHKEVYMIQLYEVDADHNILYDPNGNVKSTILMWKE